MLASLGLTVSGTANVARVANNQWGLFNNRARSTMAVTASGNAVPIIPGFSSIHGEDTPYFMAMTDVFSGWHRGTWSIPGGPLLPNRVLPTLRRMPQGTQNPVLP